MQLESWLLDILVCPKCRSRLEARPERSGLRCGTCRIIYPVRDGIPIMLISEAEPESEDLL